ncbi:MAG: hypothetical protein JWN27_2922 [Candidatus Eremiobacteraeota bacterium]|nr:hypothetical protein [Candidatus Eremiobacteraeota bacterium]
MNPSEPKAGSEATSSEPQPSASSMGQGDGLDLDELVDAIFAAGVSGGDDPHGAVKRLLQSRLRGSSEAREGGQDAAIADELRRLAAQNSGTMDCVFARGILAMVGTAGSLSSLATPAPAPTGDLDCGCPPGHDDLGMREHRIGTCRLFATGDDET